MKKLLIILMLATISVAGIATSTKTATIREGYTMLSQPLPLTAADSVRGLGGHHIVTGDSLVIVISNPQKYLQYYTMTSTLAVNSGSGTITINFWGKTTSGDTWKMIVADGSYTTGATPVTMTGATAANYNYLRISYVQSGGTECARLTAFEIKTANAFPYGAVRVTGTAGMTVTGGIVNLNASSNNAVNIGTGTTTSTITLGGANTQTIAIGNGAAAKTVALGSSNTTSTTTILAGSGGVNIGGTTVNVTGPLNQAIAGGTVVTSAGLLGGGGTATNALQTLGSAGGKAFSYYLGSTSTTASHVLQGYYMNVNYGTSGSSAAPSGDAMRGRAWLIGDASGTSALTGGAFTVELAATSASNTGLTAGLRGNIVLPDGVLTNSGTYYGTEAEIFLGGAATDTRAYTTISPLGIVISGTAATDVAQLSNMVLMDINVPANMVTADNTLIVTGATGAVAAGIKIRINGTDYWIMLASADQ
jgi:hypothetical protein